jgi:curved DNA-binding protein
LVRVQDIADVRIIPGTRDAEILRERGLGDAGVHGGPYGDLVVRVRVRAQADATEADQGPGAPTTQQKPVDAEPEEVSLDISVVESLLGGRVEFDTPQGKVRVSIPPGTSSGVRLRLKGKGSSTPDGPSDLIAVIRILVPRNLDDESRELIERFAALNPSDPRD